MSIRFKVASLLIGFAAVILIVNNVMYWRTGKELLLQEKREDMLSLSQSISAYIEKSGANALYIEALMAEKLRAAAVAAQSSLPPQASRVTEKQLQELEQTVRVDGLVLLQKQETGFTSVKATRPLGHTVSGAAYTALQQLLAGKPVQIGKGQALPQYWSPPLVSTEAKAGKWGYYHAGSADYILALYMEAPSAYDRRFNPEDVLQAMRKKSSHFLEYTIFSIDGIAETPYPLMTGTPEYEALQEPSVVAGNAQYAFKGGDISAMKQVLEKQTWSEYETEIAGAHVFKTFYPITIDGRTFIVSLVFDYDGIQDELFWHMRNSLLLSLLVLVGMVPVSILFSASLTKPIQRIVERIKDISRRNYDGQLAVERNDELGMLMVHVNEMAAHIQTYTHDLAESKREVEREAYYDSLTGLPNRRYLHKYLAELAAQGKAFAALFLDADHFKLINDLRGHHIGDELISQLGQRLHETASPAFVARQGGDEFVIIVPDVSRLQEVHGLTDRLLQETRKPFLLGGREHTISISIGLSFYTEAFADIPAFLRHVDIAMYDAKKNGGNQVVLYDAASSQVERELALQDKMYAAIQAKVLEVYMQPKVSLETGCIVGAEALVRWEDEELGVISPAVFIPLAEKLGMIAPLWEVVMEKACRQAAAWRRQGTPIPIAVNVSAVQFRDPAAFLLRLDELLQIYELPPALFEVEITESALLERGTRVVLEELRKRGIRVSIDDFGTGYSALSYLDEFPLDCLKIDRSLVYGLETGSRKAQIVQSVIQLAQKLELKLVAEGVETEQQRKQLQAWDCDEMQGFLFSRPLSSAEFQELLSRIGKVDNGTLSL